MAWTIREAMKHVALKEDRYPLTIRLGRAQKNEFQSQYIDTGNADNLIKIDGNNLRGTKEGFAKIGEFITKYDYIPEPQGGLGYHVKPGLRRSMMNLGKKMLDMAEMKNED